MSYQISFRVPSPLYNTISDIAKAERMSTAEFCRTVFLAGLQQRGQDSGKRKSDNITIPQSQIAASPDRSKILLDKIRERSPL